MVPKRVEFMAELPKTSTGKIQKFQLRALAQNFVVNENLPSKKITGSRPTVSFRSGEYTSTRICSGS
ncbi:hypothetical protein OIU76_027876 [Salix suchowensis]|nr:hypothetical protein OIU76_027876 [Salix suchowensis]